MPPLDLAIPMSPTSVYVWRQENPKVFSQELLFTKIGTATNLNKTHYLEFSEILKVLSIVPLGLRDFFLHQP